MGHAASYLGGHSSTVLKMHFSSLEAMVVEEFWSVFSIFAASLCPSVLMHLKDDRRHCNKSDKNERCCDCGVLSAQCTMFTQNRNSSLRQHLSY